MTTIQQPLVADLQDPSTIAALKRRTVVLLLLLLLSTLLTIWLVVTQTRPPRVADLARQAIPATLEEKDNQGQVQRVWTSSEMKFSELEMQILETRDYVYRTYADGKDNPVDLCVVFSEDNRKGTHPPDVCLEGSGAHILSRHDRDVTIDGTSFRVRELVTTSGPGKYQYFAYFYKCGNVFTPSFYQQQVQIILNGITRRNASGALIRYSTAMRNSTDLRIARDRVDQLLGATFPMIRDKLNSTP
jgi:EpsI family protein